MEGVVRGREREWEGGKTFYLVTVRGMAAQNTATANTDTPSLAWEFEGGQV